QAQAGGEDQPDQVEQVQFDAGAAQRGQHHQRGQQHRQQHPQHAARRAQRHPHGGGQQQHGDGQRRQHAPAVIGHQRFGGVLQVQQLGAVQARGGRHGGHVVQATQRNQRGGLAAALQQQPADHGRQR